MNSDFINQHHGFLRLTPQKHEGAKNCCPDQGYWNNEKFMEQVEIAIRIAEAKYPPATHNIVFLFDQRSGHRVFADDVSNAQRTNVEDGAMQPFQRDTIWNCQPQRMLTSSGKQKGLQTVLQECGIDTSGMIKNDMIKTLHDFQTQRSKVDELIKRKGHRAIFLLNFHCELKQSITHVPIMVTPLLVWKKLFIRH